jgi:phenylalanyl-tRNA synthetase alpha subunit
VKKGPSFSEDYFSSEEEESSDGLSEKKKTSKPVVLTNDMLKTDEWQTNTLIAKNFTIPENLLHPGKLHPLIEMRSIFRKIFLKLGFIYFFFFFLFFTYYYFSPVSLKCLLVVM